jgi:lysyl-tRNA synthetase, class II
MKGKDGEPPQDENALIAERRAKLARLREAGVAFPNDFRRDALAADLHATFTERSDEWLQAHPVRVRVAGRMMFKRVMGKASFAKLQDASGQIQAYLQAEALGAAYEAFKGWDVGDIIGVEGQLMRTRAGELSVRAGSARLLVKALRPLPDKWHGLADTETRYRRRYVDLIVNDAARATFRTRTRVVRFLRDTDDAADPGRCRRPAFRHTPQCARPGHVPACRA